MTDRDRPEVADGDRPEVADGDRPEVADGDRPEVADGERSDATDGGGSEARTDANVPQAGSGGDTEGATSFTRSERMRQNPKLLVPIDASDPEELPLALVQLIRPMRIVVLGYYPVPDQSAPEQLQEEYQEEATAALEPVVRSFVEEGSEVESVLVFTRDLVQTTDRVANEHGCEGVLVPGHVENVNNVLVSLKAEENMFRVLEVVGLMMEAGAPKVTLFHAESVAEETAVSELYLRGATDWLTERGLDRERITWVEPTEENQESDLIDLAGDHDFVVMGEYEPGIRERVVGEMPNRIHDQTGKPVLVVRKER